MKDLPEFLLDGGERDGLKAFYTLQSDIVEGIEVRDLAGVDELANRESQFVLSLSERKQREYLALEREMGAQRRRLLERVFWRAFRLGMQVQSWGDGRE